MKDYDFLKKIIMKFLKMFFSFGPVQQLYQLTSIIISKMSLDQQYVVTLSRLHLPQATHIKKLIVSLKENENDHFIQNQKMVKNHKVNFYRERIFIQDISKGLGFRIFEVDQNHHQKLLHTFFYSAQELDSVKKRAALFHTKIQGFQLIWQCQVFQCNLSEDLNSQTDKEYTQLDLDIDENCQQRLAYMETQQQIGDFNQDQGFFFKRSGSTFQSFQQEASDVQSRKISNGYQNKSFKQREMKVKGRANHLIDISLSPKKISSVISSVYSQLLSNIQDIFSGRNA